MSGEWVIAAVLLLFSGSLDRFLGEWRGNSACVAKKTACHDEKVVYRISKVPEKRGYAAISADKIVNGSAINMGTLEFRYDADHDLLICEYPQGIWRLKVDGAKIEGTLTLPDKTVFRSVTLAMANTR